jgi:hypothetical protein
VPGNDQVKKVNPYPISTTLTFGTTAIPGRIVKLTTQGFLVEIEAGSYKVGEKFDAVFELPLSNDKISEPCVVVKHYTHWLEKDGKKTPGFLLEGHFQNTLGSSSLKITAFLAGIRRKT